jgi:glycosyltransferase involved in cell wall biosynthesis
MRIAILAPGELFGGAERQVLALIAGLRAHNVPPPHLLSLYDHELANKARMLTKVHIVGANHLVDITAIKRLDELLRSDSFDVINVHGYRASAYLALLPRSIRRRVVKTEHGLTESGIGRSRDKMRSSIYRWIDVAATRRLKASIVFVTQDLQNSLGRPGAKNECVIHNGLVLPDRGATHRPDCFHLSRSNLVIASRLEAVKSIDTGIDAMSEPAMPSSCHLHIVGSGPLEPDLKLRVRNRGLENRVTFHGFRSDVFNFIAHADALLMPSKHEGLPYTVLESLALGTPVICSKVGGLAEVLTDGENALLFDSGSAPQLARAAARLALDPALSRQISNNGVALVQRRFAATTMAANYLGLFQSLLDDQDSDKRRP